MPIVGKLARTHNDRVTFLQRRIKWLENYYRGNTSRSSYIDEVKSLKAELADLLEGELTFVYLQGYWLQIRMF